MTMIYNEKITMMKTTIRLNNNDDDDNDADNDGDEDEL